MKLRRVGAAVAAGCATVLVLSGCAQPGLSNVADGTEIVVGVLDTALTTNWQDARVGNPMLPSAQTEHLVSQLIYTQIPFQAVGSQPLQNDFISVQTIETTPLTVEYTLAENMAWNDSVPTDGADLLLAWLAASEFYATDALLNPPEPLDLETIGADQVFFNSGWSPMRGNTDKALLTDRRTIAVPYQQPQLEWQQGLRQLLPAHTVTQVALDIDDPMVAKQTFIDMVRTDDTAALAKIAATYREIFLLENPDAPGLRMGNGPYVLDEITPEGQLTFEPNAQYRLSNAAVTERIRIVPFSSSDALLQALKDNAVHVAIPDTSVSSWQALQQMDRRGYLIANGPTGTVGRIDFNFQQGKHNHFFANREVRRAFLTVIDVAGLGQGQEQLLGGSESRQSWVFGLMHPEATPAAAKTGFNSITRMDDDDIAEALKHAGVKGRTVCVLYDSEDTLRRAQFEIAREVAKESEWTLEDCGTPNWKEVLENEPGGWDVAFVTDTELGRNFQSLIDTFSTGGPRNYQGYQNAELDELMQTAMHEADPYRSLDALTAVDRVLMGQVVSYPLPQSRIMVGYNDMLKITTHQIPPYVGNDIANWQWE